MFAQRRVGRLRVSALPSTKILTPEKRLMLAILQDAVDYVRKGFHGSLERCTRPARDAAEWMWSEDHTSPFSFQAICDLLDLDANALRQGLFGESTGLRSNAPQQVLAQPPYTEKRPANRP